MRKWMQDKRKQCGLTMAQAAERLDITEGYYLLIEKGERQKSLDMTFAQKLGKLFGMTIQQIADAENREGA